MENNKILMLLAYRDFRDEEYLVPRSVFEEEGFVVQVASSHKGVAVGVQGNEAEVDLELPEVKTENYRGVVLVGGAGALKCLDNENVYRIVQEAVQKKLLLGAICIAPLILTNAGVLRGKKATVYSSPMEKKGVKALREGGALYKPEGVVRDGLMVTGDGPDSAERFARVAVDILREI